MARVEASWTLALSMTGMDKFQSGFLSSPFFFFLPLPLASSSIRLNCSPSYVYAFLPVFLQASTLTGPKTIRFFFERRYVFLGYLTSLVRSTMSVSSFDSSLQGCFLFRAGFFAGVGGVGFSSSSSSSSSSSVSSSSDSETRDSYSDG